MTWNAKAPSVQVLLLSPRAADVILSLPAIYRLCEKLGSDPEREWQKIIVVAPAMHADILKLARERGLREFAPFVEITSEYKEAKKLGNIDTVYCFDRSFGAGFWAWRSGAAHRVGFSSGASTFFYTMPVATTWNEGYHEVEKNLDLLRARFGTSIQPWHTAAATSMLADGVTKKSDEPVVVITLSANSSERHWPVASVAKLCDILTGQGCEVQLVGGVDAHGIGESVRKLCPSLLVQNQCKDMGVSEQIKIISKTSLVVSGDLAFLQLCSDLKTPVVALLGPVLYDFGYAPWRRGGSVLGVATVRCLACEDESLKRSVRSIHRCVEGISGERAYREARRFVDQLS